VQVTDLAGTVLVVTFVTAGEHTGSVRYGTSPGRLTLQALDDRDVARKAKHPALRSTVHRITLAKLTHSTTYYYEPVVDGAAQAGPAKQPYKQATAPILDPVPPITIFGTVVYAGKAVPAPGTVLLEGYWTNPDGRKSWPVSVLDGLPVHSRAGATYDFVPGLVDASGRTAFVPGPKATFHVTAEADVRSRLEAAGPVAEGRGVHITIMPVLKLH
jgi:hypothetical protein